MRQNVCDNSLQRSKWHYIMTKECRISEEGETYTTYGLQVEGWIQERWSTLRTIHDIALNQKFVEELARKFNALQLSPIHIFDVLEDLLP